MSERRVLYIDPWMGVAGDMLMAALLDTDRGGSHLEPLLRETLSSLGLNPAIVSVTTEVDQGIECTAVRVRDEDNAPLRHLADLTAIVDSSDLPARVKARSRVAFERLAEVEAGVHGCSVDQIHFHEVGAVDTLVDVVGVFALLEALAVDSVGVGVIPVGGGSVTIAHGQMRVPAPATAALLANYPVVGGPEMRELTTPTGALLVSELKAQSGPLPAMVVDTVGYGCGTMKFHSGPNVLRVLVGRSVGATTSAGARWGGPIGPPASAAGEDVVIELECNLDDISPEVMGYVAARLREAGALEVWTSPAYMKKDRPAAVLHTLVAPGSEVPLSDLIMSETGSLGVRRQAKRRRVADRGTMMVDVEGLEVAVKWGRQGGILTSVAAEFDSAAAAARAAGRPLKDVMSAAITEARVILQAGGDAAASPDQGGRP